MANKKKGDPSSPIFEFTYKDKRTNIPTHELRDFNGSFNKELQEAKGAMPTMKGKGLATGLPCPDCEGGLVIKWGKNGEFLGCSNYPECRYTRNFSRNDQGEIVPEEKTETPVLDLPEVTETCPKCGKTLVAKQGRFGTFLACPGYPKCRYTRNLEAETEQAAGVPCPEKGCGGTILPRRSRWGNFLRLQQLSRVQICFEISSRSQILPYVRLPPAD